MTGGDGFAGAAFPADSGTIEVRGGGPALDRDESFQIRPLADGGYEIQTQVRALSGAYELETCFTYDAQWLPRGARGQARRGGDLMHVSIEPAGDHADIVVRRGTAEPETKRVAMGPDWLIDLEPSALPMWAMTRRYRPGGGMQPFRWIGRSLQSELVLEGGTTELLATAGSPGAYTFVERLPLPGGAVFTMDFALQNDAVGRLQGFDVMLKSGGVARGRRSAAADANAAAASATAATSGQPS